MKNNEDLKKELDNLISKKLVRKKTYPNGLEVYKYDRKVFFNNLWHKSRALLKARGLVLDSNGNIVVHPFDKVFNYQENDTGIDLKSDQKIQIIEKVNGFLGCISYYKNELIYSTTGSLDSDFVQYIKDFISPEQEKKLINFLKEEKITIMFEVVHPQDPHIIEYTPEDMGLYLIGARKTQFNSVEMSEEKLDMLASELKKLNFNVKRPAWQNTTVADLKNKLLNDKIEGFMVRDIDNNKILMKAKTSYYLTTKFLARMGQNNVDLMFKNPSLFKQTKVEEEFFSIVDYIVTKIKKEDFNSYSKEQKTVLVRNIIEYNERNLSNKLKIS